MTGSVIQESNDNKRKVDRCQLNQIVHNMIAVTTRPVKMSVLEKLIEILQIQFGFQKRTSTNVEILRTTNTTVKAFGIKAMETIT